MIMTDDKELRFIYFIMSHTVEANNGRRQFAWPIVPSPEMGQEFRERIEREHDEIKAWMKTNRDKVYLAEHGFYLKNINRCCWLYKCDSHKKYALSACYGEGKHPSCYVGPGDTGEIDKEK